MDNDDVKIQEIFKKFEQLDERDFKEFSKGLYLMCKGFADILQGASKARRVADKIGMDLTSKELLKIFASPKFSQTIVSVFQRMSPEEVGGYVMALFNLVMISQEIQKLDLKKTSPEMLQMLAKSFMQIASFFNKIADAEGGESKE